MYINASTGQRGWTDGTYAPSRNANGEVVGVIGIVHDITDRKHVEEALRASEERLRNQYQGTPVPTFSWRQTDDDDFLLEDFNTAAEVITAGLVQAWVGQRASQIYAHDGSPTLAWGWSQQSMVWSWSPSVRRSYKVWPSRVMTAAMWRART